MTKPNILIIWGDDIGWFNISAYNHGIMGYRTPNIDRVGKEGAMFTDWYGQQSCTAGRAAFISGQSPIRTGLTKVGLPGSDLGLRPEDPTIAELLKPLGYVTGQFGKNHLGDRDEFLPTMRAAGACRAPSVGRASSSLGRCPTRSSPTPTCSPRSSRPAASLTSSRSSRRVTRPATR